MSEEQNKLSRLNEIEAKAVERILEERKSIRKAKVLQTAIVNGDISALGSILFEDEEEVYDLLDDDMEKLGEFLKLIYGNDKLKK